MASARVEALFAAALEHHALGRDEAAKAAYIAVLQADATHVGALNNLGTLLFTTGYRTAARTAYAQAAASHPDDAMTRVNFANALYDNDDLLQAREHYEAALRADPGYSAAHQGLANALERLGELRDAALHRELGYRGHATVVQPYRGEGRAAAALLLVSALGGNVNTERFLDDRTYFVTKLYAEYYDSESPVPYHEFVFNAVGDAELCPLALERVRALLERTNAPVINRPEAVLATGRAENAARLGSIDGVRAPLTRVYSRDALAAADAGDRLARDGFEFPLLLRTPGFHTGQHFSKIERSEQLPDALEALPGEELAAIEFLDARGSDGNVRKYRVMIVDGRLYPLHLAIAGNWKVHYFTAPMGERPEHRQEEAAFLHDVPGTLGERALAALEGIARELDLEYAGVDFGLDAGGNVLLFEANATMLVPPPNPSPEFAYRRAAAERVFSAVAAMLEARLADR